MLREKIKTDLKKSIKQKDELTRETLRFIQAALQNAAIEKKGKELTDEEVITVLKRLSKQRKESIEAFQKGNRPDLVKKEEAELTIVKKYLPEELPEEEIIKMVLKALEDTGVQDRKEMGKVMKLLMREAKGRIDGKTASFLVAKELAKKEEKKRNEK